MGVEEGNCSPPPDDLCSVALCLNKEFGFCLRGQ